MDNNIERTIEYQMVSEFYAGRVTARSKIPLMNHINEGVYILNKLGTSIAAKRAFCLHPMLQGDKELAANWETVTVNCDKLAILLAMEYRNVANKYLSHRVISSIDEIELSPLDEVNKMLIADKIQNRKDFTFYHRYGNLMNLTPVHPRTVELEQYFQNWLARLGVTNYNEWVRNLEQFGTPY